MKTLFKKKVEKGCLIKPNRAFVQTFHFYVKNVTKLEDTLFSTAGFFFHLLFIRVQLLW